MIKVAVIKLLPEVLANYRPLYRVGRASQHSHSSGENDNLLIASDKGLSIKPDKTNLLAKLHEFKDTKSWMT